MTLSVERLTALADTFERLFRERTPPQSIDHILCDSRVTFSELDDWYFKTFGERLHATDRIELSTVLKPIFRRLRREFPDDRWE